MVGGPLNGSRIGSDNSSFTSARNYAKIEYISMGQPLELVFGVELDQNSHSKMLLKSTAFQCCLMSL